MAKKHKEENSVDENRITYSSIGNVAGITGDRMSLTKLDKGWAWIVLSATFCCHVVIGGLQHTSGIVRYALQENISKENFHYVSWLGSIYSGLISLTGPLSSLMVYKFGCRTTIFIGAILETAGFLSSFFVKEEKMFFLTYSIMAGSGSGITYTAVMIVIGYNFDKYLALASGISVSGQGIGLLVFSILLNFFFECYGLKISFLIMASISLQKCVFGNLLWPSATEMAQTNRFCRKEVTSCHQDENKEVEVQNEESESMLKPYLSLLRNYKFLNFLFCIMCSSTAEGIIYLLLPGYLISKGTTTDEAATILSLIGVFSTVTRPLMGFLANSEMADIFMLFLAPFGILGVFTLFLPFYVHLMTGRIIFGILFGLYNCSVYALLNKLTVRIVGIDLMGPAFGLEMFIWGTSGIVGTPLADGIIGWTGSFNSAFVFAGSMYIVSAITALFLPLNCRSNVVAETT